MPRPPRTPLRTFLPVGLAIIAGIVLTLAGTALLRRYQAAGAHAAFRQAAANRIHEIQRGIEGNLEVLGAIEAFYASSERVEREEFRSFVAPVLQRSRTLQAVGWIQRVPEQERAAVEATARAEGMTDFVIHDLDDQRRPLPSPPRAVHYPILYLEPVAGNELALGFDVASVPRHLESLERATLAAEPRASSRVLLPGGDGRFGLAVSAPIYRTGTPPEGAEARQRELEGFALVVVRIEDLVAEAFAAPLPSAGGTRPDVYLFDEDAPAGQRMLLFQPGPDPDGEAVARSEALVRAGSQYERTIDVAGRRWTLAALPRHAADGASWQAGVVLVGGLAFTGLVAAYLMVMLNRGQVVERLVRQRTQELHESEIRTRTVVESATDGIITMDLDGRIQSFNPACEAIFGWRAEEVVGRDVTMLMPEELRAAHRRGLAHYRETGRRQRPGSVLDVTGRTRDGRSVPIELSVSEMALGDRTLLAGILRDVTERKEVDRMKREFVSTVSHELRTPLTSINASLGLMADGIAGELDDEAQELVAVARNNSERLVRLINDILDVEKIESGRMEYKLETRLLRPLIEQSLEMNAPFADRFGIRFALEDGAPGALVEVDADRLTQVLINLLSNAAKFSPQGETVTVRVTRGNGSVRVAVCDRGPGIPEAFRDRIFEKFAQADASDSRRKGGTGLGLSICRAIMERLGGRIDFESSAEGGTTFWFELDEAEAA